MIDKHLEKAPGRLFFLQRAAINNANADKSGILLQKIHLETKEITRAFAEPWDIVLPWQPRKHRLPHIFYQNASDTNFVS